MTTLLNIPYATVDLDTAYITSDPHWSSESRERARKPADERRLILYAQAPDSPKSAFILKIYTCKPSQESAVRAMLDQHLSGLKAQAAAEPFLC